MATVECPVSSAPTTTRTPATSPSDAICAHTGTDPVTPTPTTTPSDVADPNEVDENIPAWIHLVPAPELMSFLSAHGINPVVPSWKDLAVLYNYEETRETDPFGAELTYTIDGDALTLTVDADLTVVDATEHGGSESV